MIRGRRGCVRARYGAPAVAAQAASPQFLDASLAGHFKAKTPQSLSYGCVPSGSRTPRSWVGKANELRTRLAAYARFGAGQPVARWGGRLIRQLADADALLIAWFALADGEIARDLELRVLRRFADLHGGRRPLANLTG